MKNKLQYENKHPSPLHIVDNEGEVVRVNLINLL